MTQRILASFAAFAVIFTAAAVSSSAQTAGVSSLEKIGYMLKQSYGFSLNSTGSVLTLRDLSGTNNLITLTQASHNDLVLHTVLGDLSALPKGNPGVDAGNHFLYEHQPSGRHNHGRRIGPSCNRTPPERRIRFTGSNDRYRGPLFR